ncbi:MAG: hypothetical protein WC462_02995 [archaeon]
MVLGKKALISDLRKKMSEAQKRGSTPRTYGRPRLGTRGASGPKGLWMREQMVNQINKIASDPRKPYYNLAKRVSRVLSKARAEQLSVENFPTEMQALNNVLIKLIKWDNSLRKPNSIPKPIKLTPLEDSALRIFEFQ